MRSILPLVLCIAVLVSLFAGGVSAQERRDPYAEEAGALLVRLAESAIDQRDWPRAVEALIEARALRPGDVRLRLALMEIYRAHGMVDEQIILGREILALEPGNIEALQRLAVLYQSRGLTAREEEVRRLIAQGAPSERGNLLRLAEVLDDAGEVQEEILVYRRLKELFPGQAHDLKRLAYLYGINGDTYRQLMTYREVLRLEPKNHRFKDAYHLVYNGYKREQGLPDRIRFGAALRQEEASTYRLFEQGIDAAYDKVFLFEGGSIGFELRQRGRMYTAQAQTAQTGDVRVSSMYYGATWESTWKGEKNRLSLRGGLLAVEAANSVTVSPGFQPAPGQYPWTESKPLGGGALLYQGEYAARLSRGLTAGLFFRREVVDDLDAYARLITKDGYGASFLYTTPDGASIGGRAEWARLSDSNSRQRMSARVDYPIWVSGALYDLEHSRGGYARVIPDSSLRVGYEVELRNDDVISPYYLGFKNDWQTRTLASGNLKLARNVYLTAGGSLGYGQTLESTTELRLGLLHANSAGDGRLELSYVTRQERVKTGTQRNLTYEGDTSVRSVEVVGSWRF